MPAHSPPVTALLYGLLVMVAGAFPANAPADPQSADAGGSGQLEEIRVTARKTEEPLQSVPASISVLSSKDLAAAGISDFQDVISQVPNVSMGGGIAGSLQGQLGIRGVSTLVRNIGVESGVGIYVDGVYLGRPDAWNQELIDIAQVEVLRGPQGTLFGKNTIAGVINVTTIEPGDTTSGTVKVEAGNYGLTRLQGYVTAPLIDGVLSGKLAGGYVTRDGYYRDLATGDYTSKGLSLFSYRGALYYTPTSNAKFVLAADGLVDRGNPTFFQVTDLAGVNTPMSSTPLTIDNNRPDFLHRNDYGLSLTGTIGFDSDTLTSISAFRRASYFASLDDDQDQVDYVAADRWGDISRFFSQEIRYNGRLGSAINYVAGLYYFDQKITTDRLIEVGADLGFPSDPQLTTEGSAATKDYAAFFNADYKFTVPVVLSVGMRYSREDKNAEFVQGDPSGIYALIGLPALSYAGAASDHDFSPTASLSYQFTPSIMAYARFARGFKSAAFNLDIVPTTSGLSAGPEHATTNEVGLKADWFEQRLRTNFALFDTHYEDMQVSQLLGAGVTLNNAGKARIKGGEAEITGYLTRYLKLEASGGYLDAKYDRYPDCGIPASLGGGIADCSGNRIIGAPKVTYQAAAEYEQPITLGSVVARLDFTSQSPVFFEATNAPRFESDWRRLLNARIGVKSRWEFFVWGKNLTNQHYITYRDDRSATGEFQTTAYGDPRTFGATLSTHF